MSDKDVSSATRIAMLEALASGKFLSPISTDPKVRAEYEVARRAAAQKVQPLIDASRRAERISFADLHRVVDGPGISFGIANQSR